MRRSRRALEADNRRREEGHVAPSYLKGAAGTRQTAQREPIPGAGQVANSAGGFAWEVGPLDRLRRFLILGSEGGSYYASEATLTRENADAVRVALNELGARAVEEIAQISESGRAPKNDPALFALAMATAHEREDVRRAALAALPRVARIGTHLFHFASFVEEFRGWGRALKRAVGEWYTRDVEQVAFQAVKYRQRDGWSHRDLLRLAHVEPPSVEHDALFAWITGKFSGDLALVDSKLPVVDAFEQAQSAPSSQATAGMVRQWGGRLPREALRTEHLSDPEVNRALVEAGMPQAALIRNLANLTRYGVIEPMGELTQVIAAQIVDEERLRKARVHPIAVLSALVTYSRGHGARGGNEWTPVREIVDALDAAFYASFGNVEAVGKRHMLALDVSASMAWGEIAGVPGLTPRVASAAMALVTAASGDPCMSMAFSTAFCPLAISPRQRLDDVLAGIDCLPMGGTDCALPMTYALTNRIEVDTFVVLTDSETWAGRIHPMQALGEYRERMGIDARLVVVGMMSNGFSIADPRDGGALDVVGFDTHAPSIIAEFSAGRI